MNSRGIVDLRSRHSVHETVDRLAALLAAKGIKIFARIDQGAEASAVGLTLRPTVLLIFGDPKTGTPLMDRHPSIALDLPLKALIAESPDGVVHLTYNTPEFLRERHGLDALPFGPLEKLLSEATQ
jgi:uncharacterized protein (DUF302 family)